MRMPRPLRSVLPPLVRQALPGRASQNGHVTLLGGVARKPLFLAIASQKLSANGTVNLSYNAQLGSLTGTKSGCDTWTLARIAGHSSIMMSARYVHPSEDAVLVAVERLGGHDFGHVKNSLNRITLLMNGGQCRVRTCDLLLAGRRDAVMPHCW